MPQPIIVSGGFDPLHDGHIALLRFAATIADATTLRSDPRKVTVFVESDKWVERKHPVLLPRRQRLAVIRRLCYVKEAHANPNEAGDCSGMLRYYAGRGGTYVVGPDHADGNFPEAGTCRDLGIRVVVRPPMPEIDGVHSSELIAAVRGPGYGNPIPMVAAALEGAWATPGAVLVATRADNGRAELPGGFVEPGETLEEAAAREVTEELGVRPRSLRYVGSVPGTYRDGRRTLVAGFRGLLTERPAAVPSAEVAAWRMVTEVGNGPQPWDSEADLSILRRVLDGRTT